MAENTSTSAHIIKNITIGVITTVLASVLIYFFINNPVKEERKKRKEATTRAWNSYKQNRNIFSDVLKNMKHSEDIEASKNKVGHEIDVTVKNLSNIKSETEADQRIFSAIDITSDQLKEMKPVLFGYFDEIVSLTKQNVTEQEGLAAMNKLVEKLKADMDELKARDALRLTALEKDLIKEYNLNDE